MVSLVGRAFLLVPLVMFLVVSMAILTIYDAIAKLIRGNR